MDTRIFHRECVSLAKAGYDTVLVAPGDGDTVRDGVRIVGVRQRQSRMARWSATLAAVYRAAREAKAAIYHFHDPELIPVGWLLKAVHGAAVIYDVHEYYSEILPLRCGLPLPGLQRALWHALLEKWPGTYFDHCVFPTESLRAEYARARSSSVLLNLPSVKDCSEETRAWPTRPYDVVFVGSISAPRMQFNMEVLQHLLARVPEARWLYVGVGQEIEQWVRSRYDQVWIARHLTFAARVSQQELKQLLASSRVGFNYHPRQRRFEVSIPTKVLEYLAAGLPVVTTALPELKRLLHGYDRNCLVESDQPEDYAASICTLLSTPERAAKVGDTGRQLIRESLNWEMSAQPTLLDIYTRILRERPTRKEHHASLAGQR